MPLGPTVTTNPEFGIDSVVSLSTEQRRRAIFTGQLNIEIKNLYSIALYNTATNKVLVDDRLDPVKGRSTNAEYFFTVPPKVHEMSEPFASTIVPTQNGGKFVESHGSIIKSINVSGTTGLRPNPKRRSITNVPLIGSAADSLLNQGEILLGPVTDTFLSQRGLDLDEGSGHDDIIFLRNIFRLYSDIKEKGNSTQANVDARSTVMLWRNIKDNDYWVVEPMDFRLSQNSKSPLTYEYSIQFKTLGRFNTAFSFPADPLADVLAVQRLFARIQEYNQAIKTSFLIIAGQTTRLAALGIFAETQLLSPAINVIRGLSAIKAAGQRAKNSLRTQTESLFDNVSDAYSTLSDFQPPPRLPGDNSAPVGTFKVDRQDLLVRTIKKLRTILARILTEDVLKDTVAAKAEPGQSRITRAYVKGGGGALEIRRMPNTGGSNTFLGNEVLNGSVDQDFINTNEDIRSVAGRLLGDRGRWQMLVLINNLRAPYITPNRDPGTLAPGDPILYPVSSKRAVKASGVSSVNPDDRETEGTDSNVSGPIQETYGRDLRLKSVPVSNATDELTDLAINQSGDVSTVTGIPNVNQALLIKFSTEAGELPTHPVFGARFPIGSKATGIAFNEFQIQTEATIKSDNRIRSIKSLDFNTIQDIILVNATLVLNNSADILSTNLPVRRL